jgi:hypothetical protein
MDALPDGEEQQFRKEEGEIYACAVVAQAKQLMEECYREYLRKISDAL